MLTKIYKFKPKFIELNHIIYAHSETILFTLVEIWLDSWQDTSNLGHFSIPYIYKEDHQIIGPNLILFCQYS